jgi:hypothetical protein
MSDGVFSSDKTAAAVVRPMDRALARGRTIKIFGCCDEQVIESISLSVPFD